eukprot:4741084-Amphidinium_carterae.2
METPDVNEHRNLAKADEYAAGQMLKDAQIESVDDSAYADPEPREHVGRRSRRPIPDLEAEAPTLTSSECARQQTTHSHRPHHPHRRQLQKNVAYTLTYETHAEYFSELIDIELP